MAKKQAQHRKTVKVARDSRGYLRLQFSASASREIWNKRQHYKNLGLADSEENRIKADSIANQIELDIKFGKLDASLKTYSVVVQAADNAENTHSLYSSNLSLNDLYAKYIKYLKPRRAETTFKRKYEILYSSTLAKCPQDLMEAEKIQSKIVELRCTDHAETLLGTLFDMIEWAKFNNIVPQDFPNPYKFYQDNIPRKKHQTKALPGKVLNIGFVKPMFNYRGFLPHEIPFILEALSRRGNYRNRGQWVVPVEFLFLTGFRLGEAAGLLWENVDKDLEYIRVCKSFEPDYNILKDTKTGQTRYFPCNQQVKDFLARIRPQIINPNHYVLGGESPVNFNNLNQVWAGHVNTVGGKQQKSSAVRSIIADLIAEGKVEYYYPPYGTRHTWINMQLKAGIPIQNVAEWAGNSPQTIWKNYVSYDSNFSHPVELLVATSLPSESE